MIGARLIRTLSRLSVAIVSLWAPRLVSACAVCFGDPNAPETIAANNAIIFLLGVITSVLVLFAAFFLYVRRRMRQLAAGVPGDSSLSNELMISKEKERLV